MERKGHAGIVVGLSSMAVTGFVRQRVRDRYNPNATSPPSFLERLRERAPIAIAGLGFTGLSTKIAAGFDTWELKLLSDSNSDLLVTQQLGSHRSLHSLPYMGAVYQTAKVVKHGAVKFGEWLGSKLQVPDQAEAITLQLEALADWVINSYVAGVLGHLLGDLPTSGYGGTALRLMAPLSNRNFSLGWITADSSLNTTFWKWGFAVAGAAWATTGAYLASWKPPETKVREYFGELRECESFSEVVETIETDIERLFTQLLADTTESFWNLPLFEGQAESSEAGVDRVWLRQHIDPQRVFGITGYESEVLMKEGIWSEKLESAGGSALISTSTDRRSGSLSRDKSVDPLAVIALESRASQRDSTYITGNESSGEELYCSEDEDSLGLFREEPSDLKGTPLKTRSDNETPLIAGDETEEAEVALRDDSSEE